MSSTHKAQESDRLTTSDEPEVTFHKFAELPNELKDIIWSLALTPQLVKFQYTDSVIWRWDMAAVANELTKSSPNDAIFSVCRASRDVAMREYLKYTLTTAARAEPPHSEQDSSWPPVSFFSRPVFDTFYVPRVHEFIELVTHTNIVVESYQGSPKGLECIRSLALGGMVEKAWYLHSTTRATPITREGRAEIHLDQFMDGGSVRFWREMAKFPNLEELIIVVPPTDVLNRAAENIDLKYFAENFEIVICSDPTECNKRVEEFQKEVDRNLAATIRVLIERRDDPRVETFPLLHHQRFSEWWRRPTATFMSESEFDARFNQS